MVCSMAAGKPCDEAAKQAHTITLPPPGSRIGISHLCWYAVLNFLQRWHFVFQLNISTSQLFWDHCSRGLVVHTGAFLQTKVELSCFFFFSIRDFYPSKQAISEGFILSFSNYPVINFNRLVQSEIGVVGLCNCLSSM